MIFALKSTFSLKKLKILRPKVMEILTKFHKKFCEYSPRGRIFSQSLRTNLFLARQEE
jgi:hypothetical protein